MRSIVKSFTTLAILASCTATFGMIMAVEAFSPSLPVYSLSRYSRHREALREHLQQQQQQQQQHRPTTKSFQFHQPSHGVRLRSSFSSDLQELSSTTTKLSWKIYSALTLWFLGLSYLIVKNYKIGPWIPIELSKGVWVLIHALSNMFFTGGIVLSTILEWTIVQSKNRQVIKYWFTQVVSNIQTWIVLPALTTSIIAGLAQANLDYGSMATAPKHIRLAIHILATFAIWWMATDATTQHAAQQSVVEWSEKQQNNDSKESLPKVLYWRRWSNVVSCLFVAALYALMTLKPGYY